MVDNLMYNIIVGKDQLSPTLNRINVNAGQMDNTLKNIDFDNQLDKMTASAFKFDGRLLSIMFGAMALQRLFGGMTRGMINTFLKAEDSSSALGQATTQLGAAWEFLKFSLMDALNVPWFINIITGLIDVINWFSGLSDKSKQVIVIIIAGFAAMATALMAFTMMTLMWKAILGYSTFEAARMSIIGGLDKLGMAIWAFAKYVGATFVAMVKSISVALWTLVSNPITWIVILFTLIAVSIINASDHFEGFGNMGKIVLAGLIIGFAHVGEAIIKFVQAPIMALVDTALWLLDIVDGWSPALGKAYIKLRNMKLEMQSMMDLSGMAQDWIDSSEFFKSAKDVVDKKGYMTIGQVLNPLDALDTLGIITLPKQPEDTAEDVLSGIDSYNSVLKESISLKEEDVRATDEQNISNSKLLDTILRLKEEYKVTGETTTPDFMTQDRDNSPTINPA